MDEPDGWPTPVIEPAISPTHHQHDHGIEIEAFFRQAVFEPGSVAAVLHFLENAVGDQFFEPVCEDVRRCAGVFLESVKSADTEKGFPQNPERPRISRNSERALY